MTTTTHPTDYGTPSAPTLEAARELATEAPGSAFSARLYDPMLRRAEKAGMAELRAALLADARGSVLEVGAGTGLNLEHYPLDLGRLVLTEPDLHMFRRLERRAAEFGRPVDVVNAPAELLPFETASFDTVVSTMVLCTVADARRTLDEIRRVLRPGGRLLFLEHVRSEEPRLARWQDRLHGAWEWYGDGCRCNQDTLGILQGAEFTVEIAGHAEWRKMPRLVRPLVRGAATPA